MREKVAKNRTTTRGLCAAALLFLTGCATNSPPDLAAIGPAPTVDPEPQIKAAMNLLLIDAESARYQQVGGPVPGKAQQPLLAGGRTVQGWGYCYLINAKNSLGGYTGFAPWYFVFSGDALVGSAQNAQLSSWNCF